jgi:hypothetical protein
MAQKASVSPTRFPLLAENSPLLGLGVETTSLPTPSIEMPPLSKAKPDTVGHVPQGAFAVVIRAGIDPSQRDKDKEYKRLRHIHGALN